MIGMQKINLKLELILVLRCIKINAVAIDKHTVCFKLSYLLKFMELNVFEKVLVFLS